MIVRAALETIAIAVMLPFRAAAGRARTGAKLTAARRTIDIGATGAAGDALPGARPLASWTAADAARRRADLAATAWAIGVGAAAARRRADPAATVHRSRRAGTHPRLATQIPGAVAVVTALPARAIAVMLPAGAAADAIAADVPAGAVDVFAAPPASAVAAALPGRTVGGGATLLASAVSAFPQPGPAATLPSHAHPVLATAIAAAPAVVRVGKHRVLSRDVRQQQAFRVAPPGLSVGDGAAIDRRRVRLLAAKPVRVVLVWRAAAEALAWRTIRAWRERVRCARGVGHALLASPCVATGDIARATAVVVPE